MGYLYCTICWNLILSNWKKYLEDNGIIGSELKFDLHVPFMPRYDHIIHVTFKI
jgi:hypothetical protein